MSEKRLRRPSEILKTRSARMTRHKVDPPPRPEDKPERPKTFDELFAECLSSRRWRPMLHRQMELIGGEE